MRPLKLHFFLVTCLLLLASVASAAVSYLGPINLQINNLYFHSSSSTFQAEQEAQGVLTITKNSSENDVRGGFIIVNFNLITLTNFMNSDVPMFKHPVNLRGKNRVYVFLRGKPGASLQMEIADKSVLEQPIVSLSAQPPQIVSGEASVLTWKAEHADTINIEPGIGLVPATGTLEVTPQQSTTYTLTATGPGGTVTTKTPIIVQPPLPKIDISAAPASITLGETATLVWKTENAEHCSIDQGLGPVAPIGTKIVSPTGDTTYTLTAQGQGGTAQAQITITVVTLPRIPVIDKALANYQTPENTLAASASSLLAKDLDWYYDTLSLDGQVYLQQLYSAAGIDPIAVFGLADAGHDEFVAAKIPYKDGMLVILEEHYNDTDGTIYTSAAGMVQESGLWKITFKYGEDEEVEQYDSFRYTNCIASYEFNPGSYEDLCFHKNDFTLIDNLAISLVERNGNDQTAAEFNGTSSALGLMMNDLPDQRISIGGWIKAQPAEMPMTIIEVGTGGLNDIAISLNKGAGILYRMHLDNTRFEKVGATEYDLHDNAWHHLYLTYDGLAIRLYIDGELQESLSASGRIGADANLNVGQSGGNQGTPSQYFKGMIDDIQIHRTALTSEQVLEKFQR